MLKLHKLISFFLAISLFFCPDIFALTPAETSAIQEAVVLRREGDFLKAESKLLKAFHLNPSNPDFHFELANVYAARYDKWAAYAAHPKAQLLLSRAGDELEQALMVNPEFLEARFNLGVVYKKMFRYEDSRKQFQHILQKQPDLAAAWMQIGHTYELQGFRLDAKDSYEKARELDYFNESIQESLDNVSSKRSDRLEVDQFSPFYHSYHFTPGSHASRVQQARSLDRSQGSGAFAIPFVAAALIQEFANRRIEQKVENS